MLLFFFARMLAVILTICKKNSWSSFQTVRNDKPSTCWCYTMLQPMQSRRLSSDTAGRAKTRGEEEVERERERKTAVREISTAAKLEPRYRC